MADVNPSIPQVNEPNSTADPKIITALTSLVSAVNNIETANLADASVSPAKLTTASLNYFLKLTTSADKKVEFGTTTVTCSSGGGSGVIAYGAASVTHGMGLTPSYVLLTVKSGGTLTASNCIITLGASSIGGTTFTVDASAFKPSTDLVNGTVSVAWVAIG